MEAKDAAMIEDEGKQKKNNVTNLSNAQVESIISVFDVGIFKSFKIIAGGLANTNCRLQTDRGYFLFKICDEKSYEELLVQVEFLLHVKKHGFFTAFPHPMKDKDPSQPSSYVYRDGSLRVIIYDFMNGSSKKFKDVTVRVMEQFGSQLAQLHKISLLPSLPPLPFGITAIEPFLDDVKGTKHENHSFVHDLRKQLARLKPMVIDPALPQGMVHGDLFSDNALFEGETLIAIVDWEEVSQGALLLDVAMTILGCCYPENNQLNESLMKAFLDAYNSVRPLTDLESKYLRDFIDYAALATAFWRFRQFQVRSPDPLLENKYLEMMDRIHTKI